MNEFDLIAEIRRRAPSGHAVVLGIGDDAAVLELPAGEQLVATTDNLVAGRHFIDSGPLAASPAEVGHLALAVNLSDLAAMGATPRWALLTLTLPDPDADWLDGFLDGFLALAAAHGCALVGGNISRGPLDIGVTAMGGVESGRYATRAGARPGDRIVVTGTLGDAAAALSLGAEPGSPLRDRLLRPKPRIGPGIELAGIAHAVVDISDGLLADLGHVVGEHGAEVDCARLPASAALIDAVEQPRSRWPLQFGGGDYELLALLPESASVPAAVGGAALTEIGRISERAGIRCIDESGGEFATEGSGWDHFRSDPDSSGDGR